MMSSSSTCKSAVVANAVGGKTARACDSCVRKRARWYCAADDAFLCQSCDSSVHSANSLARRHQRLRLNSASHKPSPAPPSWHAGFTRKPRTPRPRPKHDSPSLPLVPDQSDETTSPHDQDDPLLYCRVPTAAHGLIGGLPSDLDDLEEFAADVESLLGRNLESECFDMEGLGLLDCKDELLDDTAPMGSYSRVVKVEDRVLEQKLEEVAEVDLMRHYPFQFNFHDYHDVAPPVKNEITQQQQEHRYGDESINATLNENENEKKKKRKLTLRLDCEAVIAAWGSQKSPWTAGERPDFVPDDDAWPDSMVQGIWYGQMWGMSGGQTAAMGDGGREARVSRYREKRRTRLFSKKIRYEVRKLNAEKRPRMKGRFVKRTPPFAHPTLPILTIK